MNYCCQMTEKRQNADIKITNKTFRRSRLTAGSITHRKQFVFIMTISTIHKAVLDMNCAPLLQCQGDSASSPPRGMDSIGYQRSAMRNNIKSRLLFGQRQRNTTAVFHTYTFFTRHSLLDSRRLTSCSLAFAFSM